MNLQAEISEVRKRIAEEYAADFADQDITDEELVRWIFQAEIQLGFDLVPAALGATGMATLANVAAAAGVSDVLLPADFASLLGLALNVGGTGFPLKRCRLGEMDDLREAAYRASSRASEQHPIASLFGGRVYFLPASRSANGVLEVRYVKVPTRRYRRFRGTITTVTSQTVVIDSKLIGMGFPDDYFNGCTLLFTGDVAESRGMERTVSDYAGATGTFTLAAAPVGSPDINIGDPYDCGEVSVVPLYYRNMLYEYVTYLCLLKANEEQALKRLQEYGRQVAAVNERYVIQTARGVIK